MNRSLLRPVLPGRWAEGKKPIYPSNDVPGRREPIQLFIITGHPLFIVLLRVRLLSATPVK